MEKLDSKLQRVSEGRTADVARLVAALESIAQNRVAARSMAYTYVLSQPWVNGTRRQTEEAC